MTHIIIYIVYTSTAAASTEMTDKELEDKAIKQELEPSETEEVEEDEGAIERKMSSLTQHEKDKIDYLLAKLKDKTLPKAEGLELQLLLQKEKEEADAKGNAILGSRNNISSCRTSRLSCSKS